MESLLFIAKQMMYPSSVFLCNFKFYNFSKYNEHVLSTRLSSESRYIMSLSVRFADFYGVII